MNITYYIAKYHKYNCDNLRCIVKRNLQGIRTIYGGITLPNDPSVHLHNTGYKWHDVA